MKFFYIINKIYNKKNSSFHNKKKKDFLCQSFIQVTMLIYHIYIYIQSLYIYMNYYFLG